SRPGVDFMCWVLPSGCIVKLLMHPLAVGIRSRSTDRQLARNGRVEKADCFLRRIVGIETAVVRSAVKVRDEVNGLMIGRPGDVVLDVSHRTVLWVFDVGCPGGAKPATPPARVDRRRSKPEPLETVQPRWQRERRAPGQANQFAE